MKKITLSFPIVIFVSILIQSFGLLRSLILAKNFGANFTLDAFYLANVFTISVFSVIGSAVTTIVIPELNSKIEFSKKREYIKSYLTTITLVSVALSTILFIVLFLGKNIVAARFNDNARLLFIVVTFILLVSQQFRIQASFSVSLFQNEGHYIIPRLMDLIPAVIPVAYLIIAPKGGIIGLTVYTAVAYVAETFILNLIQYRIDSRYVFGFGLNMNSNVQRMLISTVPIIISSAVFQLQVMISNYFAGTFGKGYITLLSNTNQVMGIFQSLFVLNLINMIYPRMVREIKNNLKDGIQRVSKYISITNFVIIILIWGYISVGRDLVYLLFVRGRFTTNNANIVYLFSMVLGLAIPFDVIRNYCYRIYYSIGDTKRPMINSLQTVIFNIIILIIGANVVGPNSIVIAPALGTIWSCINIIHKLRKDGVKFRLTQIIIGYIGSNLVGFIMFLIIKFFNISSNIIIYRLFMNVSIGFIFVCLVSLVIFIFYRVKQKQDKGEN